jgi:hypothetical protein
MNRVLSINSDETTEKIKETFGWFDCIGMTKIPTGNLLILPKLVMAKKSFVSLTSELGSSAKAANFKRGYDFISTTRGREDATKTPAKQTQNSAKIVQILRGCGQCLKAFNGTAAVSVAAAKYLKTLTAVL